MNVSAKIVVHTIDTALTTIFDETVFNMTMKTKLLTCLVLWQLHVFDHLLRQI
jgi:hypothetical protein